MSHEVNTREDLFADPDEIIAFAQAYYATEFPNSERRGCPPAEALRKVACSGTLPNAHLRAHLFTCSECFRSFRSARISYRPQAVEEMWWGALYEALASVFTSRRALVGAGGAVIILLVTVAVFVWHARVELVNVAINNKPEEKAAPSVQMSAAAATAPAGTNESTLSVPQVTDTRRTQDAQLQRARRSARSSRTAPSFRVIEINLQDENLLRDADEVVGKPRLISLAPQRQRLRLQLPEGSAGGRYTVSIVDAFGKPLIRTSAISKGRMLTVDLDLRTLSAKRYRLCIARSGEAPDCYLVNVNDQTRRAMK